MRREFVVLGLVFLLVCCLFGEVTVFSVTVPPPEENSWVEMASMQQARSHLGAVAVDGKIYALGGQASSYQRNIYQRSGGGYVTEEMDTNEVYDPVTNCWEYRAPIPLPCSDFAVAVFEGKIYCIGGGVSSVYNYSSYTYDVVQGEGFNFVYDSVLDVWENKTGMPISREGAQANVVAGKIYVLGGLPRDSLNWVYDPLTDSWSQKASLPAGFWVYSSAVYGDKIYAVGVYAEPSYWENGGLAVDSKVRSMVQVYDPITDVWSVIGGASTGDNVSNMVQVYAPLEDVGIFVARGDYLFYSSFPVYLLSTSGVFASLGLYLLYNPYCAQLFSQYELGVFDWGSNEWVYGGGADVCRFHQRCPIHRMQVVSDEGLYDVGVCRGLPSERVGFAVVVLDDLVYVVGGDTISFSYVMGVPQYHIYTASGLVERYVPFGYGTVAPAVSILSPEVLGEYGGGVPLVFGVNRPVVWMGYSLDGQANVMVEGNTTLAGLSSGVHNVTVFVEDEYGNVGASDVVVFSVSFVPFVLSFIGVVCVVIVVGACLLFFLRKRRH
ncbi:MAG: hypothetical protein LBI79_03280 [Nitrososphaerota archaeon]|nr:hypothetical protein [Nitrososphaerota archaeon]